MKGMRMLLRMIWTSIKIIKLGVLNELAYEDWILFINNNSSVGKVGFCWWEMPKVWSFLEWTDIAWERLVPKYAPHTASSLLMLKSKFHNCKLELIKKDPDEWISNLEGLWIGINKFGLKGKITDEDFMIHVLNNFPKKNNVILNGFMNHLTSSGDDTLTIKVICRKLNHRYGKI